MRDNLQSWWRKGEGGSGVRERLFACAWLQSTWVQTQRREQRSCDRRGSTGTTLRAITTRRTDSCRVDAGSPGPGPVGRQLRCSARRANHVDTPRARIPIRLTHGAWSIDKKFVLSMMTVHRTSTHRIPICNALSTPRPIILFKITPNERSIHNRF